MVGPQRNPGDSAQHDGPMTTAAVASHPVEPTPRLVMTVEGQCNRDLALSLSKGGRGLQACFDKLSTGSLGWTGESRFVRGLDRHFRSTV